LPRERGWVLVEVMIALAVLATVGTTLLTLSRDTLGAVRSAGETDRATRRASDFLTAVSLWPTADLDRRLGSRSQGPWILLIERENAELYNVVLLDSAYRTPLLQTTLFRPRARS